MIDMGRTRLMAKHRARPPIWRFDPSYAPPNLDEVE